jgi:hypothetical protein
MRGITIAACTLAALGGGVAIAADGGDRRAPALRDCESRIDGGAARRAGDTVIGPLRFNTKAYSGRRAWRRVVRDDQWLKSIARVRAGAQVTLEVPAEQRAWMRLQYAQNGAAAVTLRACRHRRTQAARRRECVWAEGVTGPPGAVRDDYTACRTGPTRFSGGFDIDYANAPRQGRCAELIVRVRGEEEPHRVRLLHVEPGECAG